MLPGRVSGFSERTEVEINQRHGSSNLCFLSFIYVPTPDSKVGRQLIIST